MRCFVIRHGITDACTDPSLPKNILMNEQGRAQIHDACAHIQSVLMTTVFSHATIYTSPTMRTIETSKILHKFLQPLCINPITILQDDRLLNKSEIRAFEDNIKQFINDLKMNHPVDNTHLLFLVTHGRIIKMMFSIMDRDVIDTTLTDDLQLDYGDVFELQPTLRHFLHGSFKTAQNE